MPFKTRVPLELQVVLNAPISPHTQAIDTIRIDEDGWFTTLTPSSTWPAANEVFFSNLDHCDPDPPIDRIVAEYHNRGLPITWSVYPWSLPADLGERLLARGAAKTRIFAMLADTATSLEPVDGVHVERIDPTCEKAYDAFIELMSSGYSLPPEEAAFRRLRYYELSTGPTPCMHLFLAYCKGAVTGCQAMIVQQEYGYLTGVYVRPEFSARGVFQSLTISGLRTLRDSGIRMAVGHSTEKSVFWAKRFGFREIYAYHIYQLDCPPAAATCSDAGRALIEDTDRPCPVTK